jgi:adenine-specific DNA-methyltransferase
MNTSTLNVTELGQIFTPVAIVEQMLALRRGCGRTLEPAAGNGAFSSRITDCLAIEPDAGVAPHGSLLMDFFAYPVEEKFDCIIGNPPYVRYQDIRPETRGLLDGRLFDGRSNLYLFFIEKAIRHLKTGGELIFIVPREFTKLTAARKLNEFLYAEGSITDFIETGDTRIFADALPNCAIFRFERGRFDRTMHDGRIFTLVNGQFMFLSGRYTVPLSDLFAVKVGAVSGADRIFSHPRGNAEFVCSQTLATGKTRRMIFDIKHPHLNKFKETLLARRVRKFDEMNWWQWGRRHHVAASLRIYVNARTRQIEPFFLHDCPNYDGAILALFPHDPNIDLARAVGLFNQAVDWQELGFKCDGRFLFSQRALSHCLLPEIFGHVPCIV